MLELGTFKQSWELAQKFAAVAGFGIFLLESVPLQLLMLPSLDWTGRGLGWGEALFPVKGPRRETPPETKCNFSLSAEQLSLPSVALGIGLEKARAASHPGGRGWRRGEGALVTGLGNRSSWGTWDLE